MPEVVGVRFRRAGRIYYFDPGTLELKPGQEVIVETSRGLEFGEIVQENKDIEEKELVSPLRLVRRVAADSDYQQLAENRQRETDAVQICLEKIAKHELEMKLVDVEYTFDRNKIIFYFTADGRVDFRELVRDLAAVFRTRIELRQIGVRDEAKMLGGLGPCGRSLCCTTFLEDFGPISIRMAKEQNLSLNPTKISGICGRLMCCLRYEVEHYENARELFPPVGEMVVTPGGRGKIMNWNVVKKTVFVELQDSSRQEEFPLGEIEMMPEEKTAKKSSSSG